MMKEGHFDEKNILKKSLTMPKKLKGGPLVSPGNVCYAEKGKKTFFGSVR